MDKASFQKMYTKAIKKIAVGFYILDNCGEALGYDNSTIHANKHQLCGVLAHGINVSEANIYADACSVDLTMGYINQLEHSGLLEELIYSMRISLEK